MKTQYFFFVFYLVSWFTLAQESIKYKKDSIINLLADVKKVSAQKKDLFYKQALHLSKEIKNDSLTASVLFEYTINAIRRKDNATINFGFKALQELNKTKNYTRAEGLIYSLKAFKYRHSSRIDSAFYYFNKAKLSFKAHHHHLDLGKVYNTIISIQFNVKDRVGLENTALEAHQYFTEYPNYFALAKVYQAQGLSVGEIDLEKATTYFIKAESYLDSIKDPSLQKLLLNNIKLSKSYTYIKHKKFKEAINEVNIGIKFNRKKVYNHKFSDGYYWLLHNKAVASLAIGDTQFGFATLHEVYNYCHKNENVLGASILAKDLSKFYFKYNNYKNGLKFAKEALKGLKETGDTRDYLELLEVMLTYSKENKGQFYKETLQLKDSLYERERLASEQYALVKFQTTLKESENERLIQANELSNSKLLNEQKANRILQLLTLIGVLTLASVLIIANIKRKNLQFQANLAKAEARENERKKIALNLHDKVVGDLRAVYQKALKKHDKEITEPLLTIKMRLEIYHTNYRQ